MRILIVGAADAAALARRLRGMGYVVCAAAPAGQAVERAAERRPDLVVTDLDGDPAHAGVEAAERRGVPVVCLVGPAAGGARDDLPRPGRLTVPVGFAFKPLDPRQLRLGIDAALAAQARERATRDRERREAADLRRRVAALERDLTITRTVFDALHQPVLALDPARRFLMVNQAAQRVIGRTAPTDHDAAFRNFLVYAMDGAPMRREDQPLERAIRGEPFTDVEVLVKAPGQSEANVCVSITGRPLRDADGALMGGVVVVHNVTRIKAAEKRLHERVQLTDAILRNISDGVVVADRSARLTYMNDSVVRMLGIGRADVPSSEWVEKYGVFHPDQATPFADEDLPLLRAIRGESSDHVEMFVRNVGVPQGIFISVDARPLRNEAGEVSGGVAVVRDLSQTIAAREAFASGRLEVVDTVLHNIGNAMNSVTVGAGTLHAELRDGELVGRLSALADAVAAQEDDPIPWLRDDPQGRRALPFLVALARDVAARNDRLLRTADRVRDRVRHIEDIIRTQRFLTAGRAEPQVVDLKRQIADAVEVLREMLAKRDIRVEVECARAPDRIRTHESRFHQMLVNLLRNAMEALDERASTGGFGDEKPRIRITSWLDPKFLVIEVADNGIGIDPRHLRSIFSAGYTTKPSGTGLGLHSAANFVIGQGGRITPLSAGAGRGAAMRVMLRRPATLPPRPETPAEAE